MTVQLPTVNGSSNSLSIIVSSTNSTISAASNESAECSESAPTSTTSNDSSSQQATSCTANPIPSVNPVQQIEDARKLSALNVRNIASTALCNRFDDADGKQDGKHYDLRVFFDGSTEYYPYVYSKTLEHNSTTGFPRRADVDKLLNAVKCTSKSTLDAIPIHPSSTRKQEGIMTSKAYTLMGTDPHLPDSVHFWTIDSVQSAFEMAEVYGEAILRDIPFANYASDASAQLVITALNAYANKTTAPSENGSITSKTLFRSSGSGETVGPYVSQFLYKPFNYGNILVTQTYDIESDDALSVTMSGWLDIQNGITSSAANKLGTFKYCNTPRVLGSKVHNDPLYQFYYNAALIALQSGISPEAFSHPKTSAWTSTGGPDILASVAHVAHGALRVAWYQKFDVAMKIRPEVMAQRIHYANTLDATALQTIPGFSELKTNMEIAQAILDEVKAANGNDSLFLKLQFPEGSPTHPSWPAGHATVAGACVTVLKAMLQCHNSDGSQIPWVSGSRTAEHSIDGDSLVSYTDSDASSMTVIGEFNKLASNAATGRNMAGVHYRCDGDCGIMLGEQYAISYLEDVAKQYWISYQELFDGWTLEKFDGSRVKITHTGTCAC